MYCMIDASAVAACARLVDRAVARIPGKEIVDMDADDLRQELIIPALRAHERADGRPGDGYVRTTVANAVRKLWSYKLNSGRHPQDCYGRTVHFADPEVIDWHADERARTPEDRVSVRERVEQVLAALPVELRQTVVCSLNGDGELTVADLRRIRFCVRRSS